MGLVSGLSLTNHSDSESFLVVHSLLSQDGCQRGFWEVVGHVVSPFDLSWTLLVGTSPCSLLGPPVVKQLVQVVTMVPGQGEQFQSGCSPNSPFKGIPPFLCPHKPFAFVISKLFWKMIFSTYTYWDIKMVNPAIFFFFQFVQGKCWWNSTLHWFSTVYFWRDLPSSLSFGLNCTCLCTIVSVDTF